MQREDIESAIVVEQLDTCLYRSINLWRPAQGRGAFGGQVIAQALWSATCTVDPAYDLESCHCYFISFGDVTKRIIYRVETIRDGRTYATRAVKAEQDGRSIFYLLASFQKKERQVRPTLGYQPPMPHILPPQDCVPKETMYETASDDSSLSQAAREYFRRMVADRRKSNTEILYARPAHESSRTSKVLWMRCHTNRHVMDPRFNKCILAYVSDFELLATAAKPLDLKDQNLRLAMLASLDHSMHFYSDLDPTEYFLYETVAEATGKERGTANGRMFSRDGKLCVVCRQEGVIRIEQRADQAKL